MHSHLKEATSWPDLERRLAGHRLRLEKRGPGLVVTDGRQRVKASRLYRRASYGQLEKRFGMSFDEWRAAKRELVAAVDRLEKVDRARLELRHRRTAAHRAIETAQIEIERLGRARKLHGELTRDLDQELRRVFRREEVPRVRQELERQARQHGWKEAGRRLAHEPRRFGKVRGAGLGPVRTSQRTAAVRAAARVGRLAADIAAAQAWQLAVGPAAARSQARLRGLSRTARRASQALKRMPTRRQAQLEVAKKALALGLDVVQLALAPNPLRAVKTALRAVDLVRSTSRDHGRER